MPEGRLQPNRPEENGYTGVGLTFGRVPLVLEPSGLAGADIAIVGAPFDEGVSYRPGTRFGPRAIRSGEDVGLPVDRPNMELGIDPYKELDIVDYGDVEVRSSNLAHNHAGLQARVGEILSAGAVAIVLGGDHSLSTPVLAALSEQFGTDGFSVIHFDTHADTGRPLATLSGHSGTIGSVEYSDDDRTIRTFGDTDGTMRVFDAPN